MHDRRVLGIAFAVIIAGALAVVIWTSPPRHCPLVLNIVSVEPADIDDDTRQLDIGRVAIADWLWRGPITPGGRN